MRFSKTQKWSEETISKLAEFFAFIFVTIGVVLGAVLERIETFRPIATKVQTLPRFVTRLKERIA